jgi:hypothetical protein
MNIFLLFDINIYNFSSEYIYVYIYIYIYIYILDF